MHNSSCLWLGAVAFVEASAASCSILPGGLVLHACHWGFPKQPCWRPCPCWLAGLEASSMRALSAQTQIVTDEMCSLPARLRCVQAHRS